MMQARNLLDRRLLFVVGKGGVGKTTVATALALVALRRKKRVLLVEMEEEDRICPLLGVPSPTGRGATEILPGLYRASVEGRAALEEYLALVIPIRRVLKTVFENKVYQYFVAAAPGLKELMTVGKIWYEVDQDLWDLVIVDCPATGHSLQYLRMPRTAYETFTTGLVHREARRVWELLCDPVKTAVFIVSTAEEMPVKETLEISRQLAGDLGLPREWIFVNRFHMAGFAQAEIDRAASPGSRRLSSAESALAREVMRRAREELSWSEINETHRRRLELESGCRLVLLPYLFREEFGLKDVEELANHIEAEVGHPSLARAGAAARGNPT